MVLVSSSAEYASIALQFVLIVLLLFRRHYLRYPLLLIYSIVFLAASLAEVVVLHQDGVASRQYRYVYMLDEAIIDLLFFLMVMVMTYQAMGPNPLRAKIGKLLTFVVIGALLLPFLLFRDPIFKPRWFNETSQLLNFSAAVMNLALWTALLGNKKRDRLLLSVSAGLGIAVTGAAITYGLHHFRWASQGTARELVDLIKGVAHLVSLVIWCFAFWKASGLTGRRIS